MDFFGLFWVASFLNQDTTSLPVLVGAENLIGHPTDRLFLDEFLAHSAWGDVAFSLLAEPKLSFHGQSNSDISLLPERVASTEVSSFTPLPTLLSPGSLKSSGVLSLSEGDERLGLPFPLIFASEGQAANDATAANAPNKTSRDDTIGPMGLQPLPNLELDPRDVPLTPQLPILSKETIDWDVWHSVADVSVVPIKDKAQAKAEPVFLKLHEQCLAFPTTAEKPEAKASKSTAAKTRYQVWVHDVPVGEVKTAETAYQIATKLRRLLQVEDWQPSRLKPLLNDSFAAGRADSEILFVVDDSMLPTAATSSALIASQWINNLRVAFGEKPLELSDVQMVAYGLKETRKRIQGTASWYGPYFHGRKTATGEIFNQHDLTAAHPSLPFDTYLKVRNLYNGKTIVVRINDRGPYVGKRSLDLSYAAAQCLGSEKVGVIPYEATILKPGVPAKWEGSLLAGLNR
ncbi:MAG TPA: septal ring lytic transglycosylase RlpA family protein [Trichocoleus sp.]